MRLPAITFSVESAAEPEAVFDYFADPARRPEWQSSLRAVESEDQGAPREGVQWTDVTKVPGVRAAMRTTVHERPTRWAETGEWRGIAADLEMRFAALPGGRTRIDVRAQLAARGPWVVPALGALAGMPLALRSDVKRAARLVAEESDTSQP